MQSQIDYSKVQSEPTGFFNPDSVIVTWNWNRTVTLTGDCTCYYQWNRRNEIFTGYVSPVHDNTTTTSFFLAYDGSTIRRANMSVDTLDFRWILICYAVYSGTEWLYLKETHWLMNWQTHKEFHNTLWTYLVSGWDLAWITLSSTTAANRRPTINETKLADEDVMTTLPLLWTNSYTIFNLSATNTINFSSANTDIISLSTNQPYYNQFTGWNWTQTLFPNNAYGKIYVMWIPVASDTVSQKYRYVFIQPQTVSTTLATIQAITPDQVNLWTLWTALPEFYYFGEIIVRYTTNNRFISSTKKLVGTKISQVAVTGTPTYKDWFIDYNDLTTATTPIAYTTGSPLKLTNDWAWPQTLTTYKPIWVTRFRNTTTNQFDFTDLSLWDELNIRVSLDITTSWANQTFLLYLSMAIGGGAYTIYDWDWYFKTAWTYQIGFSVPLYMWNTNTITLPAEIMFSSDANATIKVNWFYISAKRRF